MVLEDIDNERFYKVRLYFVKDGDTENSSNIPMSAIKDAEPTIYNIPLLAKVKNKDFMEHEMKLTYDPNGNEILEYIEQPIGFIPKDCKYRYEEIDGETWASCIGIIWKEYCRIPINIINSKDINNVDNKISMEIRILDSHMLDNGILSIDKYFYRGITMLGSHIQEGIKGAKLKPLQTFSKSELKSIVNKFEEDYNNFNKIETFNKPKKYEHINFKPPESVAKNAQRGLDMRAKQPESNKCCTSVGLARARQLVNRQELSPSTVKRMKSYFERHEVDKTSSSWKEGDSKGEQAWLIWGGDSGFVWAKKIVAQMEKADKDKEFKGSQTNIGLNNFKEEYIMNKELMKKIAYSLMDKGMSLYAVEEGCAYAMGGSDEKMMKIPYAEENGELKMSYELMASEEMDDVKMAFKIMTVAFKEKMENMKKDNAMAMEKFSKIEEENNKLKLEVAEKITDIEKIKSKNDEAFSKLKDELKAYKEEEIKQKAISLIDEHKDYLLDEDVETFSKQVENKEIESIETFSKQISDRVYNNVINKKINFAKLSEKKQSENKENVNKMPIEESFSKKNKEIKSIWEYAKEEIGK